MNDLLGIVTLAIWAYAICLIWAGSSWLVERLLLDKKKNKK